MRNILKATFAAAALVAISAATLPAAPPNDRIITLREPGSPYIAFNIWVKAGSSHDPAGKEGLAALTAAMIARGGTQQDRYQVVLEKLYPMAAGYAGGVDKEMTTFTGRIHRDNLDAYYALFRNALLAPAFAQDDFDRIKAQVLNGLERTRRYSRDEELSKDLLFWMAYKGTPYAHPEAGYVESVRSITLDDVKRFYAENYRRDGVVVGIGGGYPEGFAEKVRQDFDALPAGAPRAIAAPQPKMPDGVQVLIVEKETDASAISMGFPTTLLRNQPDFVPMMVFNSWFGEHRNSFSHLYQVIREIRGMNYGDYSYIEAFPAGYATQQPRVNVARRSQLFEIWIRPISLTAPGNLHDRTLFATRAAWRELDRVVNNGMDAKDVETAKQFLHNYSVPWGGTISRRLAYAVDDAFYGMKEPGFLKSLRGELAQVTPASVNAAIRENLQAGNMYLVLVTADAEGMKQKLLSGAPTNITYAGTRPAEVLEEDKQIASFPIRVKAENITIIPIDQVFQK